jgi:hypothetical protein
MPDILWKNARNAAFSEHCRFDAPGLDVECKCAPFLGLACKADRSTLKLREPPRDEQA